MKVQVEVVRNPSESTANVLRRFTKRVQGAGILKRARSLRYFGRPQSLYAKRKLTLKKIAYRAEQEQLKKLGKEVVKEKHGRR